MNSSPNPKSRIGFHFLGEFFSPEPDKQAPCHLPELLEDGFSGPYFPNDVALQFSSFVHCSPLHLPTSLKPKLLLHLQAGASRSQALVAGTKTPPTVHQLIF